MRTFVFWIGWVLLLCGTLSAMYSVTVANSPVVAPLLQAAILTGAGSLAIAFALLRHGHPVSHRRMR